MPYKVIKLRGKDKYKVVNIDTGKIMAYHTTKEKAMKQLKLLGYLRNKNDKKKRGK